MMRPHLPKSIFLVALLLLASGLFSPSSSSSSSSSSFAGVDDVVQYAPPSQSERRAMIARAAEQGKGPVMKKILEGGLRESSKRGRAADSTDQASGRSGGLEESAKEDNTMVWVTKQPEVKRGELEGAFAGRNRKKKKHRRLDALEVATRKLEEKGLERADGSLDEEAMLKFLNAQDDQEKAVAAGHSEGVPMQQWTLEELDKAYPTAEGNKRLGIKDHSKENLVEVQQLKRYERSSNFVQMRRSAAKNTDAALHSEILNYTPSHQRITVFVESSVGIRYAVDAHEFDTVADFKAKVWAMERQYRYPAGSARQARDKAEGFRIEEQQVIFNLIVLEPDSTTLKSLNVEDYSFMMLLPKQREFSQEEMKEMQDFFLEMSWERERGKAMMIESDSEADRDPDYRAFKEAAIEATEKTFNYMADSFKGLREAHARLVKELPNAGMMPHFAATDENLAELERKMNVTEEEFFRDIDQDMELLSAQLDMDPVVTPEMLAQTPIEVTEEAFLELVAERTEMLGQPFAHLMKSDGRGNFTVVAKDELVDDRVVSSADLNNFDEARRDVAAKSDDGFLRDANLKEEDVETFSIPEDLMEQVKEDWIKTYGPTRGDGKDDDGDNMEYHDSPIQLGEDE